RLPSGARLGRDAGIGNHPGRRRADQGDPLHRNGAGGLPGRPQQVPDARPVGRAGQSDPRLPELGHPARCAGAQARAAHRRGANAGQFRFDGRCQLSSVMAAAYTYLDHNATSPMRPVALDAMVEALKAGGNPSSVHRSGRAARARIDKARRQVAALVGALPGEVVFTAGGTEANNLALRGHKRVLASAIEHESVLKAVPDAARIPVDANGVIDLSALERLLAHKPALVSVMVANNETGVIQPIAEVVRLARGAGALVHCDAVQAAGKMPVDLHGLGVDYLSLSAHKLGGPTGVGALIVRNGVPFATDRVGGGQETYRRAGTENV